MNYKKKKRHSLVSITQWTLMVPISDLMVGPKSMSGGGQMYEKGKVLLSVILTLFSII